MVENSGNLFGFLRLKIWLRLFVGGQFRPPLTSIYGTPFVKLRACGMIVN